MFLYSEEDDDPTARLYELLDVPFTDGDDSTDDDVPDNPFEGFQVIEGDGTPAPDDPRMVADILCDEIADHLVDIDPRRLLAAIAAEPDAFEQLRKEYFLGR